MAELEQELRALAALVELPAERDLAAAVRARVEVVPRRRVRRRALVALAAACVALAVAFAVPPARSAILRFLGLEGVSIVRVDTLPPVGRGPAASGTLLPLAAAEREVGFRALLPDVGPPSAVYADVADGALIVLYGRPELRLRVTEVPTRRAYFGKVVTAEQRVEPVRVGGAPGVWIEGAHVSTELYGQPRLSGNALIWETGGLALRLEGKMSKAEALRIANSFRHR